MPIILYKNCGPIENVYNEVYKIIKNQEYDSFILIVPTRRKVRELQRELLKISSNTTSPAFNLFTLETFAIKLYEIFFPPLKYLNATTQAILFEQAIKNCRSDLKYFISVTRDYSIPKGTFNKIISVINHLRESGVYISNLYAELDYAEESEKAKLNDILLIYKEYEKLLNESFIDTGGIYKRLNELVFDSVVIEKFFKVFPSLKDIFITGFDEFKDPEITLIDNISKISFEGRVLNTIISFDYHFDNDELFGHLKENYEKFRKMGFNLFTQKSGKEENFRDFVIKKLFKENNVIKNTEFGKKITLITAETRQEEVETIAKIIKYCVYKSPKMDLSKICISMYQPQLYTNLFHEVFSRYGIPANITDRFSLDQSPVVVSIISLLNILQNNFMRRDLMRTLSSPYFTFEANGIKISAGNLISVSSNLKINFGKNIWKERIDKRISQIEIELKDIDDEVTLKNYHKEKDILIKAKNDFEGLIKFLDNLKYESTPVEFRSNLLNTLESLHISENILKYNFNNSDLLEKDTRAYQKFINILDELTGILIFENGKERKYNLSFYIEKLKAAISQTRYNIRQKYGYGVYVTSFEETRGLEFDTMFIIGMVDGEFPREYSPEIFFSKERQKQKEKYHLTENRYLFYQCLTNFSDKLYLSYPKQDGEVELVRSPFIDDLLEIVEVQFYEKELKQKLDEIEFNEEGLLSKIGFNLSVDSEFTIPDVFDENWKSTIDFISYAIGIEKQRYMDDTKSEYNGYILEKLSKEALKKLSASRTKVYSITQLEKYAKCPFSYFISNLLKISVIQEPEEGITPLERGSILHEILFDFYRNRIQNNLPLLSDSNDEQIKIAIEEITKIAKGKLETIDTNDLLAFLDKELIIGTADKMGLLQEFVNYERNRNVKVKPRYFEAAFGTRAGGSKRIDKEISTDAPVEIDGYKIRGKVDRIDIDDDYFAIIDYKTGSKTVTYKNVVEGLALQLPIYLYAVEKLLSAKHNKHFNPAAAIYYTLSDKVQEKVLLANEQYIEKAFPKAMRGTGILTKEEELSEIISKSIDYVKEYINCISEGKFPIATDKNINIACNYCEYHKICRKPLEKEF